MTRAHSWAVQPGRHGRARSAHGPVRKPQLAGMAGGALSWLEHAGGELDAAIGRVLSAFGAADEGGQA